MHVLTSTITKINEHGLLGFTRIFFSTQITQITQISSFQFSPFSFSAHGLLGFTRMIIYKNKKKPLIGGCSASIMICADIHM